MQSEKFTTTSMTISAILGLIKAEDIAIPEIQRPFVWKNKQVRDLMDSLYQGYPVGYIILWKNPNVKLKDGTISAGKKVLIDGQQRVPALMTAIAGIPVINSDYKKERITLMSFMNPVTVHDSILPKTMIASNNMGYFKDSVFLDVDNTGSFVGGHFDNVTFIADNENIEVLSYKQSGNPDMCNKQYSDFFESNNVLLDSVNSGTTIIIRHPGINKSSEPIIINKPVNLTGVFDATWSGDITFVSGSEGSNLTDMTLNGTVYINTTNIGLYNNTVNKGVVIKDSADNIIVDNTFNTEDVAITLVNTIQTNIQNNDITSQAEYAIALDDDSIENTITKNIIYSADKEGNDAVNGDTTTNTISANKPGPVIFTLTDSTWSEFFNDDGTAKDIVEAGAELRFDGVFNNRDMVISVPLNLTV